MKENSWVFTLVTQISLCFALYIAFTVGQPREALLEDSNPFDLYFISVAGGFRPEKEQALLLRQMAAAAELYRAHFVVSISQLGEDDPLNRNATRYFRSQKIPWYTTRSFNGQERDHYIKHVKNPHGKSMDVIFVNSQSFLFLGPSNGERESLFSWLRKTLEESVGDWRVVVGFHTLLSCNVATDGEDTSGPLHTICSSTMRWDAYLNGCKEYIPEGTMQVQQLKSVASPKHKGPCLTPLNKRLPPNKELVSFCTESPPGICKFTVARVVTYLVNLDGEVIDKIEVKQIGREVM